MSKEDKDKKKRPKVQRSLRDRLQDIEEILEKVLDEKTVETLGKLSAKPRKQERSKQKIFCATLKRVSSIGITKLQRIQPLTLLRMCLRVLIN